MDHSQIGAEEILLRRLPPSDRGESIQPKPGGGFCAMRFRMMPRKGRDVGISCTRLSITSPRELLEQLRNHGEDPDDGWRVCWLRAADVLAAGFTIVADPTDEDDGHCEIRIPEGRAWRKTNGRALAAMTTVLTDQQVRQVQAGDYIET